MDYAIQLLARENITLNLMDIGASGKAFKPFEHLFPVSNFIGFDPDSRDTLISKEKDDRRSIFLNKAVTPFSGQKKITFYLTKNPHCSSTIKPVLKNLSHWPYSDSFEIIKEVSVSALSISEALKEARLDHIDWLKIDSQGTDLRIIESIPSSTFNQIIAFDTEPGLYEHYENADLFPEIHTSLINKGFWLADLNLQTQPRISETHWHSLQEKASSTQVKKLINRSLKRSPTATEARYLRTIPSAVELNYDYKKFLIMWAISLSTKNLSYAYDIACEIEKRFPRQLHEKELVKKTCKIITSQAKRKAPAIFLTKLLATLEKLTSKS